MHSQTDKGLGHAPTIILNSVCNADGSATCTIYGVTVVATVNGPLEAARGDQSTDEATLEVQLRPSHGGAGMSALHGLR